MEIELPQNFSDRILLKHYYSLAEKVLTSIENIKLHLDKANFETEYKS